MAIVVDVLGQDLAGGALAANQAGEMLGHADETAAVVAQVEHQLGGAGVPQGRERLVEGRDRWIDEVPEHDVADLAAVHFVELRQRDGRDGDDALREPRLSIRPFQRAPLERHLDALFGGAEGRRQVARRAQVGDRAAVDGQKTIAALEAGFGSRAVREDLGHPHLEAVERRRHPEPDELAGGIEGVLIGAIGDVGVGGVERLEADRLEIGLRRGEGRRVQGRQLTIPVVVLDQGVADEPVLGLDAAGRLRFGPPGGRHRGGDGEAHEGEGKAFRHRIALHGSAQLAWHSRVARPASGKRWGPASSPGRRSRRNRPRRARRRSASSRSAARGPSRRRWRSAASKWAS